MRCVVVSLFVFLALMSSGSASALEEPAYDVVQSYEDRSIEIRDYERRILAVTDMSAGPNSGFRTLAGYIFGGNEREQEIAMTVPVQSAMPNVSRKTKYESRPEMAFVVPREFAFTDLPKPNDSRVTLRQEPAYRAAVIRFSGWVSDEKAESHWQKLSAFLTEQGIQPVGEPTLNQYNPPWTLPFLRRNEIIVAIAQ